MELYWEVIVMMKGRRGGGLPDITVLGGDVVNKGEEGWLPDGTVRGCYVERYAER